MSQETLQWLNSNTLIGYTDKRGHAWHYRADDQGAEANHYTGAIPVDDVLRRLFNWKAVEATITATAMSEDGVITATDAERKAIVRPDTGLILGYFAGQPGDEKGYKVHQYDEWLIEKVATLLDADLQIGSAGLLQGGGVAWVAIELEDTITTPEGVEFRPFLSAATSHNGSLSSTYKRSVSLPVCDNTLAVALSGTAFRLKIKHSRYSNLKLQESRDALAIIEDAADEFSQQVAELCATTVTDKQWAKFLDELLPIPEVEEGKSTRGKTIATNKRDAVQNLWDNDNRVSPWRGTAFGVVQAVNTASHHVWNARGEKAERNMLKAVDGSFDKLDQATYATLAKVLA